MLALESPGTILILDDALARRVAEGLKVPFTGTLGILLDGKKRNLIQTLRPHLESLQALRFRLSAEARSAVLRLAGEE